MLSTSSPALFHCQPGTHNSLFINMLGRDSLITGEGHSIFSACPIIELLVARCTHRIYAHQLGSGSVRGRRLISLDSVCGAASTRPDHKHA